MREGLRLAAAGRFTPKYYQVQISRRRVMRYRRPGMASRMSEQEAWAVQAFAYLGGCTISEIARRFCRHRRTVRKALRSLGES
jgi:hypothetical protein